ncbi:hypothetical protein FRB97_006222 [Tulasnella sp. 331]|nr:hypothetical protein FRB97_006222 [Tulasnella sp. 331]
MPARLARMNTGSASDLSSGPSSYTRHPPVPPRRQQTSNEYSRDSDHYAFQSSQVSPLSSPSMHSTRSWVSKLVNPNPNPNPNPNLSSASSTSSSSQTRRDSTGRRRESNNYPSPKPTPLYAIPQPPSSDSPLQGLHVDIGRDRYEYRVSHVRDPYSGKTRPQMHIRMPSMGDSVQDVLRKMSPTSPTMVRGGSGSGRQYAPPPSSSSSTSSASSPQRHHHPLTHAPSMPDLPEERGKDGDGGGNGGDNRPGHSNRPSFASTSSIRSKGSIGGSSTNTARSPPSTTGTYTTLRSRSPITPPSHSPIDDRYATDGYGDEHEDETTPIPHGARPPVSRNGSKMRRMSFELPPFNIKNKPLRTLELPGSGDPSRDAKSDRSSIASAISVIFSPIVRSPSRSKESVSPHLELLRVETVEKEKKSRKLEASLSPTPPKPILPRSADEKSSRLAPSQNTNNDASNRISSDILRAIQTFGNVFEEEDEHERLREERTPFWWMMREELDLEDTSDAALGLDRVKKAAVVKDRRITMYGGRILSGRDRENVATFARVRKASDASSRSRMSVRSSSTGRYGAAPQTGAGNNKRR